MQSSAIEVDLNLRLQQQEAIAQLGEVALACKDLQTLFDQCVRLVADTLGNEMAKVLELLPEGQVLLLRAGVGWQPGLVGQAAVSAGRDSQAGYTLLTDEPVIVSDLRAETRFYGPDLLFNHNVISGMSVIIQGRERPFGVLGTHSIRPRRFTIHDARFLKSIANILASAVERFRVESELRGSRDELAIILNGITEGVTAQDASSGRLVYANSAAARIMGLETAEELLTTPLPEVMQRFILFDEQGQPLPVEKLPNRQALQWGQPAAGKVRFRIRATGEENWAIVSSSPIFDDQGKIVQSVSIFRNITRTMREDHLQRLLAEAGRLLSSSLDYETTLANVARLAVDHLADWCTVHILTPDNEIQQLAVAHIDPQKMEMAREYNRKYPTTWETNSRLIEVLRSGQAEYFPEITDAMIQATARDAQHLVEMRTLGMKSAMMVPLIARGSTLGAISLIWAELGRRYSDEEVGVVQELARRAALAIDNARLYREAQTLNAELEQRVARRTEQLQSANRKLIGQIEERVKAEMALRKSETLLNNLFESAPDATVLVDRAGRIARVNRQAEILFGYRQDELLDKPANLLLPSRFHSTHLEHQAEFFTQAVNRPMGAGRELYARHKDGQELPVDIMLSPVIRETGQEDGLVISSIRDMTEQRRLQAELAETHQRLFESMEAERLSLSRELHDGPIQDLYGLSFNNELLRPIITNPEEIELLDQSRDTLQAVIQTLRNICSELRPHTLEHLGLEKAIRSHLAKVQELHPEVTFDLQEMNSGSLLPERVRLAFFRAYQNAIANILRHAHAHKVSIMLEIEEQQARLQIRDDGQGFTVPARWVELARAGHFGLVGMIERAQAVGGRVDIVSTPGQGTQITITAPIQAAS